MAGFVLAEVLADGIFAGSKELFYERFIYHSNMLRAGGIALPKAASLHNGRSESFKIVCAHPVPRRTVLLSGFLPRDVDAFSPVVALLRRVEGHTFVNHARQMGKTVFHLLVK